MPTKRKRASQRRRGIKRTQRGGALDVQKWIDKPAKNFIGLAISTWALARIWPNV